LATKGKCFSMVDQGQRKKNDAYGTPYSMTYQLLEKENFLAYKNILEPACGDGAILRVLLKNNFAYDTYFHAQDIEISKSKDIRRGISLLTWGSYLDTDCGPVPDLIITNPPYKLAKEFILKAKKDAKYKIAMLLPLSYLHGQSRYTEIWQDREFPLKQVHVFTRYPLLGEPLREDGKYHTGMQVYAWYIWDRYYEGEPTIDWIDNNKYVLKKGE
jgi:hypothetical protein